MAAPKSRYSWLAHQPMQQKILVAIGTLVLLFVICSVVSLQSLSRQDVSAHWSRHTYDVRARIDDVTEHLQASQMALRGFLLNPQGPELAAHQQANAALERDLSELRTLTSDNPLQQGRIDRIESMADQWQKDAMQNGIEPMQAIRASDATEATLERVRVQTSYLAHRTIFVADILGVLKQMDDTEAALLDQREATQQRDVREVRAVTRVVDGWKEHFKSCGVTAGDIELYAEQIDRPFLRDQRNDVKGGRPKGAKQ